MDNLKQQFEQLQEKIDALTLRERAILFIALSFILYTVIDYLLLSPLKLTQQGLLQQIQTIQTENSLLESRALGIINRFSADPNLTEQQQLLRLNKQLDAANQKIEKTVAGLISPERMAIALENLLQGQNGLKFISIDNLPAELLVNKDQGATEQEVMVTPETLNFQGLYRHSFRLQFEGSYLETLAYLQELEGLKWRFHWDEIDLTMLEYPTMSVTIVIHTISLDEGVIGV